MPFGDGIIRRIVLRLKLDTFLNGMGLECLGVVAYSLNNGQFFGLADLEAVGVRGSSLTSPLYAGCMTLLRGEDPKRAEELANRTKSMVYAHMHRGPWYRVENVWRQVMGMASAVIAVSLLRQDRAKEALEVVDRGLILCGPHFGSGASELVEEAEKVLGKVDVGDLEMDEVKDKTIILEEGKVEEVLEGDVRWLQDAEEFGRRVIVRGEAVVFRGGFEHWEMTRRWKRASDFVSELGHRTVPVELGSHYAAEDALETCETILDISKRWKMGETAYIAQHSLLDQIPSLQSGMPIPSGIGSRSLKAAKEWQDATLSAKEAGIPPPPSSSKPSTSPPIPTSLPPLQKAMSRLVWIGPPSTLSPTHYDRFHNLLVQVVGHKRVVLLHTAPEHPLPHTLPPPQDNTAPTWNPEEPTTKQPPQSRLSVVHLGPTDA